MKTIEPISFFNTTLTKADVMPSDVSLIAGQPVRLFTRVLPVGLVIAFGRGLDMGLEATEGRIFVDLRATGAAPGAVIDGILRLVGINQLGQEMHIFWEGRTENVRLGLTDMSARGLFPAIEPALTEGFSYALVVVSDTTVTASNANSTIFIEARRGRRLA